MYLFLQEFYRLAKMPITTGMLAAAWMSTEPRRLSVFCIKAPKAKPNMKVMRRNGGIKREGMKAKYSSLKPVEVNINA